MGSVVPSHGLDQGQNNPPKQHLTAAFDEQQGIATFSKNPIQRGYSQSTKMQVLAKFFMIRGPNNKLSEIWRTRCHPNGGFDSTNAELTRERQRLDDDPMFNTNRFSGQKKKSVGVFGEELEPML
eukprot:scaffold948_cov106-Cylindrotheca_fusiformis.AAC.13